MFIHLPDGSTLPADINKDIREDISVAYMLNRPYWPGAIIHLAKQEELKQPDDEFLSNWNMIQLAVQNLEIQTNRQFGNPSSPLFINLHPIYINGHQQSFQILKYLGLNPSIIENLSELSVDKLAPLKLYRRFVEDFCILVGGVNSQIIEATLHKMLSDRKIRRDTDLSAQDLWKLISQYQDLYQKNTEIEFPLDPYLQLRLALNAGIRLWNVRPIQNESDLHGQEQVSMLMRAIEGFNDTYDFLGIVLSRDPFTGERRLFGEIINQKTNECIPIDKFRTLYPDLYEKIQKTAFTLEKSQRTSQQFSFVITGEDVWVEQSQKIWQTLSASMRIAVEMVYEGIISRNSALEHIKVDEFRNLLLPHFDETQKTALSISKGIALAPGVASGVVALNSNIAEVWAKMGKAVIFALAEVGPEDMQAVTLAKGIIALRGGATSHSAVVARGLGIPFIVGEKSVVINSENKTIQFGDTIINEGDGISMDGSTGEIFLGTIPTVFSDITQDKFASEFLDWTDQTRQLNILANADTPADAALALKWGAQGIGLCRIEHMFLGKDRLTLVQEMICFAYLARSNFNSLRKAELEVKRWPSSNGAAMMLAEAQTEIDVSSAAQSFYASIKKLCSVLQSDLYEMFCTMSGLPLTIRLIDPPLHEFLPSKEDISAQLADISSMNEKDSKLPIEREILLRAAESLHEVNPMMGMRGVRLYIMFPDIAKFQVTAILSAAIDARNKGFKVHPEIMIPFVGHLNELIYIINLIKDTAADVFSTLHQTIDYKLGTMIELPRAVMIADELAKHVDFFSFGTNDLTQLSYGYSRDDAETKFLHEYIARGILAVNPFQEIDKDGVVAFMKIAVEKGRKSNPNLVIGVCGEHGGDAVSINILNNIGIDYISCSPLRVPIARLAAAKAALRSSSQNKD